MTWRVPGIWVRAFKKTAMQLAPILRIRHFVYVLSRVPGHGRYRHRNSLTQTESQRVWVRNFKLNTLLRTLWASCRSRNANVKHKFPQWYDHVSANRLMRQTIVNMAKLGGEVPKKREGTCGTPIFFIAKPVLSNILLEGFPIRKYIWYLLYQREQFIGWWGNKDWASPSSLTFHRKTSTLKLKG